MQKKDLMNIANDKNLVHNTHYFHWLADVHSVSVAPAFTLSVS